MDKVLWKNRVIFWEASSGQKPADYMFYPNPSGTADFELIAEGKQLAFTGLDGTVTFWDVSKDPRELWKEQACSIAGRNLTQDEWQQHLGDRPYEKTCPQYSEG